MFAKDENRINEYVDEQATETTFIGNVVSKKTIILRMIVSKLNCFVFEI